ncbi:nonsense-mediated mRNA decay protein 1 [Colletotrichum karsti]|uniref:Nonsense-mediated mRNA decay protein 1 n=1 Tax=Colletotrichum karsti TaxID=1095194 RepID=A0A9P6ICN9_9PEZI|nr:nonsense-mediated mRNA decay protein 1 [Colletotrichum karsti]KAF9879401.1 nonsense-mediated mRNA decay protein 1 [Colletotrichum karsti]
MVPSSYHHRENFKMDTPSMGSPAWLLSLGNAHIAESEPTANDLAPVLPYAPLATNYITADFFAAPVPQATFSHLGTDDRGCGHQMVHSFLSKEEFAQVHREGSKIEMQNEEAGYRRFNDTAAERHAWVIYPLPTSTSLMSSDLQTKWIVLVSPGEEDEAFPAEGEDCSVGIRHDFVVRGQHYNPGMLKSQRVPVPFDLEQYSACAAFEVTLDYMRDPRTKMQYHPFASIAIQRQDGFPAILNHTNAVKVIIRVTPRLLTHEVELRALDRLMNGKREMSPLEKRAMGTFDYILDFRKEPKFRVNLFQELPHMDDPLGNPETPEPLKSFYRQLNHDHKKAYEQLRSIPAGLRLILGCPGAGKTALNAFIATMALSQSITEVVNQRTVKRTPKVLYLIDVNEPCDDAANRVHATCKEAGLNVLVVRVRGCAREMSRSAKLHPAPTTDGGKANTPDFSRGFLKQAQLAQCIPGARRDFDRAPSLDEAAWELFEANPSQYKGLEKILNKLVVDRATKTRRTASELRVRVAKLYFEVIKKADFIATTPVGASGQLSEDFKPDLVFVDEAAHARELTSLIPLAFTPARAYIFTGDTRQTRPFVKGASMVPSEVREKGLLPNPYAKQLRISTMERADLAQSMESKLQITHRMYGDLHLLASDIFYDGLLTSGMVQAERFSPAVQHVQRWLRQFIPDLSSPVPRILIHHQGAQECMDRRSFYNPVHEAFIKQRCLELLCDENFKRVDKPDQAGRILIITPYKAALARYKQFTTELPPHFRGRLDVEMRHEAMEARTVDSAQGHEADFVFVDTVRTKTAGFLNDPKRLCVMLTRSRIGEMILMHEGMTTKMTRGVMVDAEWTRKFCKTPLVSSPSSTASPTVTYITGVPPESLTTIVESQIVDVTVTDLDNKVITGVLMATTVVRLKDAVITTSTTSASVTGPTTSAASLTPDPTPPASKAWIAGPVIGAVFLVLLLLAGFWFIQRRKKRRAAIPTTTTDDVDDKEKYAKAELHAEHTPRPVPMELEGSYPDPVPEMSVNEVPAQEIGRKDFEPTRVSLVDTSSGKYSNWTVKKSTMTDPIVTDTDLWPAQPTSRAATALVVIITRPTAQQKPIRTITAPGVTINKVSTGTARELSSIPPPLSISSGFVTVTVTELRGDENASTTASSSTNMAWIAGPIVGGVLIMILLLAGLWFLRRRRRKQTLSEPIFEIEESHRNRTPVIRTYFPIQPAMELEGCSPKTVTEMSADEISPRELYVPGRRPVYEMSVKNERPST